MPVTDPISDMLTIVRNGSKARKEKADVKSSRMAMAILDILKKEGFIRSYKHIEDKKQGILRVYLRYTEDKSPVITGLKRVSKPGLRIYRPKDALPNVLRGIGIAIVSTSSGVMTNTEARKKGIGGEIICHAW